MATYNFGSVYLQSRVENSVDPDHAAGFMRSQLIFLTRGHSGSEALTYALYKAYI